MDFHIPDTDWPALPVYDIEITIAMQPRLIYPSLFIRDNGRIKDITRSAHQIFAAAQHEIFESGMNSVFSLELTHFVKTNGTADLESLLFDDTTNNAVTSEAFKTLGKLNDPSTYGKRLHLLGRGLLSAQSVVARDGALLGLASLDDPDALHYLEEALRREPVAEFRNDIQQVIEQLLQDI